MAENPIKTPLTADLPEDWTAGQIVAPDGEAVGLTKQHGYNYLMEKVNETRQAVNAIGESFETIGGKRTCRFTVGTSASGWTAADCDYLCDGTDDQEEIQAAVNAVGNSGEIVLLSGSYHLSGPILLAGNDIALRGNGPSTQLYRETNEGAGDVKALIVMINNCSLTDLSYNGTGTAGSGECEIYAYDETRIERVSFFAVSIIKGASCIRLSKFSKGAITISTARIESCTNKGGGSGTFVFVEDGSSIEVLNNSCPAALDFIFLESGPDCTARFTISGNAGTNDTPSCGAILLDGYNPKNSCIIANNCINRLTMLNSKNPEPGSTGAASATRCGNLVSGNIFLKPYWDNDPVVKLGQNTKDIFVTGNMIRNAANQSNGVIQDLGSNNIVRFNSDDPGGSTPATVEQAAPVLAVSASGQVTATAVQQAGYVAAGTKNAALTLSAAQDADFIPENIKKGVSIFGVEGQLETDGGTAGVTSFNGRSGAVMPGDNDYTAQMVGAISSEAVSDIQLLSQEEYDALPEKDAAVLYLIKE